MTSVGWAAASAVDCEAVGTGLVGQPANTVSSLALVLAGAWLVSRAVRSTGPARWRLALMGAVAVAAGAGSVAFHGSLGPAAPLLHDIGLVSLPLAVIAIDAVALSGGGPARATGVLAGLLGVSTPVLARTATATPVVVVGVLGALAAETAVWARGGRIPPRVRWRGYGIAAGAGVLGVVLHLLGRTGAPLCEPASLLQAHAAWHVLAAVALAAFSVAAFGPPPAPGGDPTA